MATYSHCQTMHEGDGDAVRREANVTLNNADMWRQFHDVGTEMIITKGGRSRETLQREELLTFAPTIRNWTKYSAPNRRMFPSLNLNIAGLEPESFYSVVMDFSLVSELRYKYSGNGWVPAGHCEPQLQLHSCHYVHPDSPAKGSHWMNQPVSMHKAKLTNNPIGNSHNILLHSMHKYIPRVHIVKTYQCLDLSYPSSTSTFVFPETDFIAVTAYQNEKITKLKIENNPFARGFRENGLSRIKRKLQKKDEALSRKRSYSEQSSISSTTEDSGRSSLASSSPPVETISTSSHSRELVTVSSPPIYRDPWESINTLPVTNEYYDNRLTYPYFHPFWRYSPYLPPLPIRPSPLPFFPQTFWPFPPPSYYLSNYEPVNWSQEPVLMDLSMHHRDYTQHKDFVKDEKVPNDNIPITS